MVLEWLREKYEGSNAEGSLKVPGEEEALELVRYHEKEWKRITKGVNLRDLEGTRKNLKEAVHNYNEIQRLKPYGLYFELSPEGVVEEREIEPLIERSRTADYKITLSAEGLPTKNIEDLTVSEAEEYYEAIKKEITDLKERKREREKMDASTEMVEHEIYLIKERCALALRVIAELSDNTIPKNLLQEYEDILWNLSKKSQKGNPDSNKETEFWDVKCVDDFEYYHKNLTYPEIKAIRKIRAEIFNPDTPKEEISDLYREAIKILHKAWCRRHPRKRCVFRERTLQEEEWGYGFFGVSEAYPEPISEGNPGEGKEETTELTPEERLKEMQRRSEEIAEHIKLPYHVYKIEYNSIRYKSPYHEGSLFVDRLEDYGMIQKILDDFADAIRITQDILRTCPSIRRFYGFKIRELQTDENFLCPYVNLVVDMLPVGEYFGWGSSGIGQRGMKVYWHSPGLTKEYLKEGSRMIEATPPATTAHEMEHTFGSRHEIIDPLAKIVGLIFYLKHPEYVPQVTDFDWLCFEMVDIFSAYLRKDRVGMAREQLNALYKAAPAKVDTCIKKELSDVDAEVIKGVVSK